MHHGRGLHCSTPPWGPTYAASSSFMSQVAWVKAGNQSELMRLPGDDTNAEPVHATCALVGTVSPLQLLLKPHGNVNLNYEKSALETSKLQFQVVYPTDHAGFDADFGTAMERLETSTGWQSVRGPRWNTSLCLMVEGFWKGIS
jgi:hypothetical protein